MDTPLHFRHNLRLLWLAMFISKVGDQLFAVAGGFMVMMLADPLTREAPTELGVFEMVHALPALLVGPFLGVLVDRFRRRRVMVVADLCRALLLLAIPAAHALGVLDWWVLCGIAFGVFAVTSAFAP
ncbi:MAG: MFS transporter, partial [Planctomycetes bacterium]|nr:MFS transporter [Planctomycetota bacterium]